MSKPKKVPRASIACTILDDEDYIGLMATKGGAAAFGVFCALICAAKVQKNKGVFKLSNLIISRMIQVTERQLLSSCKLITHICEQNSNDPWITGYLSGALHLRNFLAWNSWGGSRDGAGRPSGIREESSGIQDGQLDSTSDSDSDSSSYPYPQKGGGEPPPDNVTGMRKTLAGATMFRLYKLCPSLSPVQRSYYYRIAERWIRLGILDSNPEKIAQAMAGEALKAASSAVGENARFAEERAHKAIVAMDLQVKEK